MVAKNTSINDLKEGNTKTDKWLRSLALGFGIFGFMVLIFSALLFNHGETFNFSEKINATKFGDLGSFLSGSVGTIWTLVSVLLFYLALRLQSKELGLQRDELELTRNELSGQKAQMVKQNETLSNQQFENTFFQLIQIHTNIVNSMDLRKQGDLSKITSRGRDCFHSFYKMFGSKVNVSSTLADTISAYDSFFQTHESDLGHYFRNLYHIIKFVHNSDIKSKQTYSNFVRAQLSSYELVMLFYNCLSPYGKEKFKPLIEEYALLKNMNTDLVINQNHLQEYDSKAYKSQEHLLTQGTRYSLETLSFQDD